MSTGAYGLTQSSPDPLIILPVLLQIHPLMIPSPEQFIQVLLLPEHCFFGIGLGLEQLPVDVRHRHGLNVLRRLIDSDLHWLSSSSLTSDQLLVDHLNGRNVDR